MFASQNEPWKSRGRCGVDFAAVLAKLRLDPLEPERFVNGVLRLTGDPRIVIGTKKTVLIQLDPQRDRAITQHDVVGFRSSEILHRGAAALGRNEPEVCLVSAAEEHARFGGAVTEDAFGWRKPNEHVHQGRIAANRKNVDVTAGFTPAAQASDRNEVHRGRLETEV